MTEQTEIGIIICDRYRSCAGGKCFRSVWRQPNSDREGLKLRHSLVGIACENLQ